MYLKIVDDNTFHEWSKTQHPVKVSQCLLLWASINVLWKKFKTSWFNLNWPLHFLHDNDNGFVLYSTFVYTVWPETLAGNLFWWIGGFDSDPTIFPPVKFFYSMMSSLRTRYYVTSSTCGPLLFKMSARKLQTLKEWNNNSPNLVYCQLAPAWFNVLWFEMDPAVFTQLTVLVCYICHHFVKDIIMVQSLPNRQSKIRQMPLLEQSAKYSSRQNSGRTVCCCVELVVFFFSCQLYKHISCGVHSQKWLHLQKWFKILFAKMSRMDLKLIDRELNWMDLTAFA